MKTKLILITTALLIFGWDLAQAQFTGGPGRGDSMGNLTGIDEGEAEEFTTSIPGPNEGWRMLGAPVAGATYADMFDGLWTQGFPGASFEGGASNVYYYDEATRAFTAPSSISNIVGSDSDSDFDNAGRGILAWIYEDDFNDGTSTDWPKTISVSGVPLSGEIAVPYSYTDSPDDDFNGWHFASNPYPFSISWESLYADGALQNMIPVIFIYDSAVNDYRVHYGVTVPGLPGNITHNGILPAFQGFWTRANGTESTGTITFRESYQTTGGTLYDVPELPQLLAFSLTGEGGESVAMLQLNNGPDVSSTKPMPISPEPIRFGFLNANNPRPDVFRNTEAASGDQLVIPLDFAAVESGEFSIKLHQNGFSAGDVTIMLRDSYTGAEHQLTEASSYSFFYEAEQELAALNEPLTPQAMLKNPQQLLLESEQRFALHITFGTATNLNPAGDVPREFALHQNYPNPFNPTTQIQYALPEAAQVRLEVFNMAGQRVATLVNGHQNAGTHTVSFDATNLASGVYIYRLTAGSFVQTRKMLLVK